jgi:hypothetical protein
MYIQVTWELDLKFPACKQSKIGKDANFKTYVHLREQKATRCRAASFTLVLQRLPDANARIQQNELKRPLHKE